MGFSEDRENVEGHIIFFLKTHINKIWKIFRWGMNRGVVRWRWCQVKVKIQNQTDAIFLIFLGFEINVRTLGKVKYMGVFIFFCGVFSLFFQNFKEN